MNEQARRNLRNVLVVALIDGELDDQEKQFIESVRSRLGIDSGEFEALCEEMRRDPRRLSLPRDPVEAEETVRLLVEAAAADGRVSDAERNVLRQVAAKAGLKEPALEELLAGAAGAHDAELKALSEQIYAYFAAWDAPTRRQKVAELARFGRASVEPLLHIMESYRAPEGAPDALELKRLVAEQLGRIGDPRGVYYLAQQVNIGDLDDEITDAPLRYAAAEALGRIVGEAFTADQPGVQAARTWWFSFGIRQYDQLTI